MSGIELIARPSKTHDTSLVRRLAARIDTRALFAFLKQARNDPGLKEVFHDKCAVIFEVSR